MQKKLIALAVAGLASSAAFAQSNVTVYGVVDAFYGHASADGKSAQSAVNSGGLAGSRIGFKGTEDLGNGLKALFTLEYGVTVDDATGIGAGTATASTANSAPTARQQFVGLTGNFGTFVAGRLQTAGYDWSATTNALHGTAINPLNQVQGALAGNLLNSSSRANNAVAYISPEFGGGFKVAYNHARVTEAANTFVAAGQDKNDNYANLLSGTYTNGPVAASLIYAKTTVANTSASDDLKEWGLGGSYDFGAAKVFASYQTIKSDATTKTNKAWNLSTVVPVSATGAVIAGYAANKVDTASNADSHSWTLAYKHTLSKRTALYTGYQRVTNDSAAALGTALNSAALGNLPTAGGDASLFVAGMNHSF